jgi:hypothetical protein
VITTSLGTGSVVVTPLANGWFRIAMTFVGSSGHDFGSIFYPESTVPSLCTGAGNFIFGFQLANLPSGSDYVPTTTSPATQQADLLSFPSLSSSFTALVNTVNQSQADADGPQLGSILGSDAAGLGVPIFEFAANSSFGTFPGQVAALFGPPLIDTNLAGLLAHSNMVAGSSAGRAITTDGLAPSSDNKPFFLGTPPSNLYLGSARSGTSFYAYGDFSLLAIWWNEIASTSDLILNTGPNSPVTIAVEKGRWQAVQTDANGRNDQVMLTTLCQVLKLGIGESPFWGDWGIPAEQAVIQQIFPDYYVALTQQRFAPFFLSLTVTRESTPTPTYDIRVITTQGVVIPPGSYPQ